MRPMRNDSSKILVLLGPLLLASCATRETAPASYTETIRGTSEVTPHPLKSKVALPTEKSAAFMFTLGEGHIGLAEGWRMGMACVLGAHRPVV